MDRTTRPSTRARGHAPTGGKPAAADGSPAAARASSGAAGAKPAAAATAGAVAGPASDVETILGRALDEAARLLGAEGGVVFLAEAATGTLRAVADAGPGGRSRRRSLRRLELAPDDGMVGRSFAHGEIVITGDYPADPRFRHDPGADAVVAELGVRSVAVAPLLVEARPIGAIGLYSPRPDAFGADAVALVRILAEHAAASVANLRLIDDLARARQAVEHQASSERTLGEMAARLSAVRDPDELLGQVVRGAGRLVGADGAILARYDPDRGIYTWAVDDGVRERFDPAFVAGLVLDGGAGPMARAVADRRAVILADDLAGAFARTTDLERFLHVTGFRSMIAAPIIAGGDVLGALGVFAVRPGTFGPGQADLISAFAAKAAIALANARLIAELGRAREAAARRAEAERTLHDIGAKVTALADPAEVLEEVVAAARRLVGAEFANIDLVDAISGRLAWTAPPSAMPKSALAGMPGLDRPETLPGLWGHAIRAGRAVATGDYVHDPAFIHEPQMDANAVRLGIQAGAAVALRFEGRVLGALQVATTRPGTFDEEALALLDALASDAATAIANSRWIAELDASRAALARRADVERALREIAADISRLHDPAEVVQRAVDEAARLLGADGARVDVLDPELGSLPGVFTSRGRGADETDWRAGPVDPRETGMSGLAIARGECVWTGDYAADDRFRHDPRTDAFAGERGVRSIVSAPLFGEERPFGSLTAYTSRPDAFGPDEAATLSALAAQVAISLTNAGLIDDLARSREEIAKRADRERALREIAARVTALRDPDEVLQRIVDEAVRLLEADGSRIDLYDERSRRLRWGYAAGATAAADRAFLADRGLRWGEGLAGLALAEDRTIVTADFAADPRVARRRSATRFARLTGVRSLLITPLRGELGPLGVLSVESIRVDAFDDDHGALLEALAAQAAVAITNSRRLDELTRSREDLGRSVATERTLRQIAARITALTDLPDVLASVVEEARRLLGSDGAHLTRMAEERTHVYPVIIAGGMDAATAAWLQSQQFPINGGINGLAAGRNQLTWTEDYRADRRIPLEADDLEVAERMGLRAMAAAPLRAPGGEVIGTLAVSYNRPRTFDPDDLERLQGLADHAAIALANSLLFERLAVSEARYRQLVSTSPDVVWETDADGVFTFVSDGCLPLVGMPPEEIVGHPFTDIVAPASIEEAIIAFGRLQQAPVEPLPARLLLRHRDGTDVPVENIAIGRLDPQGRFAGGHGSARDLRPREALERELRRNAADLAASEERAHLARELHDSVTQALFSMGLVIRSMEMLLERDPAAVGSRLAALRDLQRDALAETRSLVFELRPGSLAEEGLERALRTHVAGLVGRIGLPVILDLEAPGRLPLEIEETLYRIAQEALHNVVKHAAAREVRLELRRGPGEVVLAVVDDGVGFDPTLVGDEHLGLAGMRARAERAGGRLEISSRPGGPTRVVARLPAGAGAA